MLPYLDGLRVLVVEDEGLLLMLIEEQLTELGCQVVGTATRLHDALAKARSLELDVAMLDVNLAGELSYPVALALRERNIPFVFATGYGSHAVPEELAGTKVVPKPFRAEQLAQALKLVAAPDVGAICQCRP